MDNRESDNGVTAVRQFFSLKWKALLLTSLVLVAVTVAISLRSYVNLNAQFDRHRQSSHERYLRDVQALIDRSLNRLRELGGLIPSLPGMQQSLASGETERIRLAFEPQWPVLQLDLGIDVVSFYDASGRLLASWDTVPWNVGGNEQALAWVEQVNRREMPVAAVNCTPGCLQYAVVPVLAKGRSAGALLLGSSLADVVLSFRQVSGNDIGLLVVESRPAEEEGDLRWLGPWEAQVVALTEAKRNLEVLRQAALDGTLPAAVEGVRSTVAERSYEVKLIALPEYVGRNAAYLAVIADITDTLKAIRAATQEIVVAGSAGWLLAELLLLAILWTPMSRLRATAHNLPLLAQSEFQAARSAILGRSRRNLLDDEIDVLDATAVQLADRLEVLEAQVAERTRALARRMEELALERDFIASLLNTAQVIILTQDHRGRIVMANPFAQTLTGYPEQELLGQDFFERLFSEGTPDLRRRLKEELSSDRREHLRHESLIICKDGSIRNVTWYHSRLSAHAPDDAVILSVGLDITERRGAESRLAWLADHDTLTGLLNRRRFQEELDLVIAAAQRQNRTGVLLLIDLDQFKYVNDTGGHHSGDALLKLVANALAGKTVAADVVARLGSDEFAVLLREADAAAAADLAATINGLLGGLEFAAAGQTLQISASVGIVIFPTHADNVADLLASADLAVFQAKEEGRGRWHLFSETDKARERMRSRVFWREKVSQALAQDRFVLYYQPIMEIATRRVSHYEVLLRMQEEDGRIIGPAHFIDAAERGGMIHAVDRMVIAKAVEFLAELNRGGWNAAFSINLSGHAFNDPQLMPYLRQVLERSQVDTSKVIFEITETAAVSDFAIANSLMLDIKELGCRFALDDFGIGFSSFYYLKHLPVDYLKIDGSFIRQLADSLDDQIIVRAMSQAAAGFGKKTIAEFVETETTLTLLREYGIDYAQGYLISQPRSAESIFGSRSRVGEA